MRWNCASPRWPAWCATCARPRAAARRAGRGFSTATDLADWLVRALGLPFRQAHHVTGEIVKRAEAQGCTLADLPLAELQAVEPEITASVYEVLMSSARSPAAPALAAPRRSGCARRSPRRGGGFS